MGKAGWEVGAAGRECCPARLEETPGSEGSIWAAVGDGDTVGGGGRGGGGGGGTLGGGGGRSRDAVWLTRREVRRRGRRRWRRRIRQRRGGYGRKG